MLFSDIEYLAADFEIARGYVAVSDGRISYVGAEAPADAASFGEQYSGAGRLLVPGFYNIHAHAPMTLLRGFAESMNLQDWLNDQVFPFEAKMTASDNYYGSLIAIAEMLRFGVVSYSDMYFETDERIRAVAESGIKANICPALMVFDPDAKLSDLPEYESNQRYVREFHNSQDGRVKIDLNIHSEYISNPAVVQAVGEQAKQLGVGVQVHVSETALEHQQCKERRDGMTPAAYLDALGLFDVPATAAHCVWAESADWQIFARKGVTVAACPASNLKLASGFAALPEMLAAGINVGLGTDGAASNNNHNFLKDIYLLATVYKASSNDPTVMTPAQSMRAATLAGALAQGRPDCGTIAVGNRADLVVFDIDQPWMKPVSSLVNNLVYAGSGSDVVLTMVDGTVLYRDGNWPTIDIERVSFEAQAATNRIVAEL